MDERGNGGATGEDVPADLLADRIERALETERYGRSLEVHALVGSTNDEARRAIDEGAPDGHVVVADAQCGGRGRHGRVWASPAGTDLYFSVVARPGLALGELPPLTLATGLSVADVASDALDVGAAVKWPNDVWIGRRKLCGILVETTAARDDSAGVVLGVGLNVNRDAFPDALRDVATSLSLAGGHRFDRAQVLAGTLHAMERWIDRLVSAGPAPVIAALRERLALCGSLVRVDGVEGVLRDVDDEGALLLETATGTKRILSGTVQPADAR